MFKLTIWGIFIKFCIHINIEKRQVVHLNPSPAEPGYTLSLQTL